MRFIRPAIIITTCDRNPAILGRAVRTALDQELPGEVIVVNDGLKPVTRLPPGARIVETGGRRGLSRGRNVGLSNLSPSTNAVCYLDDDDELLPQHTRLMAAAIGKGAAFAFSRAIFKHKGFETEDPEPNNPGNKRYYDSGKTLVKFYSDLMRKAFKAKKLNFRKIHSE